MTRKPVAAFVILMLAIWGCHLPSAGAPEAATPAATATTQIEVIIEDTPSPTPLPTETPPPTETPLPPAELTLTKNSNCRLGPSGNYVIIDQIASGTKLRVAARNEANTWWKVINPTNRECWIFNENAAPNYDFTQLDVAAAPPLPNTPVNFILVDQQCSNPRTVTVRWTGNGGEKAFRLFRDGKQIIELKADRFNFKDERASSGNKAIRYEIEAVNENGTSERAVLMVPACK